MVKGDNQPIAFTIFHFLYSSYSHYIEIFIQNPVYWFGDPLA